VDLGDLIYCESTEMVNAMSGHVITAAYMRQPIISLYLVFSVGVSTVGDTAGELRLRLMSGSMGVTVAQASWRLNQVMICLK
jgi:hypothetical protein